jgi:hypothetical protein
MKKDPRTLLAIALPTARLLSASTTTETQRTSERSVGSTRVGEKVDHVHPFACGDAMTKGRGIHVMSISKSPTVVRKAGSGRKCGAGRMALGLVGKFIEFAYKTLEDGPTRLSTSHGCGTYGFGANSMSLSNLAVAYLGAKSAGAT